MLPCIQLAMSLLTPGPVRWYAPSGSSGGGRD
jgi:hypothetical protein